MIDEKKLIEEMKEYKSLQEGIVAEVIETMIEAVEEQPKIGEWIPCSERLPEIRQDCLVTVRYTGFMGMHGIWIKTGHMEGENDWWGDCAGGEVIAWQPLPLPFRYKE